MFLEKGVLKICSKFTGEHPWRSVISIKLLCDFIEITLRHGCSPVILLHILRIPFLKNTSGWLLLKLNVKIFILNPRRDLFQFYHPYPVEDLKSSEKFYYGRIATFFSSTFFSLASLYYFQSQKNFQPTHLLLHSFFYKNQ